MPASRLLGLEKRRWFVLIAATLGAFFVWDLRGQPPFWIAVWLTGLTLSASSLLRPEQAVAGYVLTFYATPRYSDLFTALVQSGLLHAEVVLALVGLSVALARSRRMTTPDKTALVIGAALFGWIALSAAIPRPAAARPVELLHHPPVFLVHAAAMLVVSSQVMGRRRAWRLVVLVLCAALALRVFWQGIDGIRLEGDIGPLSVMALPLAVGLAQIGSVALAVIAALAAVGSLATAALTYNRATAVAFAVVALVMLWQNRRRWWLVAATVLMLGAAGAWLSWTPYRARFAEVTTELRGAARGSVSERLDLWRAGETLTASHPIIGIGPGRYASDVADLAPQLRGKVAHNSYVQMAVETGIPGLLLYVAFFLTVLVTAQRARRRNQLGAAALTAGAIQASVAGYLTAGLFISRQDMVLAYVLAGWASAVACTEQDPTPEAGPALPHG